MDRMKLRIENGQYVDCVTLSASYLWALRQKQSHLGEETKVSLGQGLTLSGGPVPVKNVASVCDPVQFQQGWNLYVLWHAQSQVEETRNKLADRLMWYDKLWRYGPTLDIKPEWRVKYAKEFMFKYQESDVDWSSKFETDFTLLREFLDRGGNGVVRAGRTFGGPMPNAGPTTDGRRGKRGRSGSRSPPRSGGTEDGGGGSAPGSRAIVLLASIRRRASASTRSASSTTSARLVVRTTRQRRARGRRHGMRRKPIERLEG